MPEPAAPILDQPPSRALPAFAAACQRYASLDAAYIERTARRAVAYYGGDAATRARLRHNQDLERRWYDALARGAPDYGVYGGIEYVADVWACWAVYSRTYLREIRKPRSAFATSVAAHLRSLPVAGVVDVGCGFGYTTAALARTFPALPVYGTQLAGTAQMRVATAMGRQHGFAVVADPAAVPVREGLVFASEYFEHFQAPVAHLRDLIAALSPGAWLIASAFGATSIGHFDRYRIDEAWCANTETPRRFDAALRDAGYTKVKTALWNQRPSYWVRE